MQDRIKELKKELKEEKRRVKLHKRAVKEANGGSWWKKSCSWTESQLLKTCEAFEARAQDIRLKRDFPHLYQQKQVLEDVQDAADRYTKKVAKGRALSANDLTVVEKLYAAAGAVYDETDNFPFQFDDPESLIVGQHQDRSKALMEQLRVLFPNPEKVKEIEELLDDPKALENLAATVEKLSGMTPVEA